MARTLLIALSFVIGGAAGGWAQQAATPQQKPAETRPDAQAAPPRMPAQVANVRLEVTVTDRREGASVPAKTVTLLVADRENARLRSGGRAPDDGVLNVDARPEIVRDGRARVFLSLEYRPARAGEKEPVAMVTQSLSTVLEDGKPVVISQSADPTSNRSVSVEVKATIVR